MKYRCHVYDLLLQRSQLNSDYVTRYRMMAVTILAQASRRNLGKYCRMVKFSGGLISRIHSFSVFSGVLISWFPLFHCSNFSIKKDVKMSPKSIIYYYNSVPRLQQDV